MKKLKEKKKSVPKPKTENIKILTHLYLNNKYIQKIDIPVSENVTTLFLHNNQIKKLENFDNLKTVTHLYLQRNLITKIENLECLQELKKLYIGMNKIAVIEKLEALVNLEELHIEKQKLNLSDSLCFDPRTVLGLKDRLKELNISNNKIHSIECLKPLRKLKTLIAKNNEISDIDDIINTISGWFEIYDVNFVGNPVTKMNKYREELIVNTVNIQIIDEKEVHVNTKIFLKNWNREKSVKSSNLHDTRLRDTLNNVPPAVMKTVSNSLHKVNKGPDLSSVISKTVIEHRTDEYIPGDIITESKNEIYLINPEIENQETSEYLTWNSLILKSKCIKPKQYWLKKEVKNVPKEGTDKNTNNKVITFHNV